MALNDVSLTSGMRSNLLSLQGTVDLMNRTQNRLSTGKKVNSAIDNPVSFFAAQALTNRASKISSLKDAMGQAVQTITAADKGISAITAMIEQAKGIAQSALTAPENTGFTTVDIAFNSVAIGDTITLAGSTLVACVGGLESTVASVDILLGANMAQGETIKVGGQTYIASAGGAATGYTFIIGGDAEATSNNLFAQINTQQGGIYTATGATANTVHIVAKATGGLTSTTAENGTYTATITNNAGAYGALDFERTGNDVVDAINLANKFTTTSNAGVLALRTAGYTLTADNGVVSFAKGLGGTAAADVGLADVSESSATTMVESLVAADSELKTYMDQFNDLLTQMTAVAGDSGYKGKNLLDNVDMEVQFEGNTLTVNGFDASATAGLGIGVAAWTTGVAEDNINTSLDLLDAALDTMSQEGSKMSGALSIITVRQDFSASMINTLTEGADKLTLADTNEEGANMLMLQTRQSLSTTALSLSAQAAQSVLRLFQ